jgi:agmatinase
MSLVSAPHDHDQSHSHTPVNQQGRRAQEAAARLSLFRHDEEIERALAYGLRISR